MELIPKQNFLKDCSYLTFEPLETKELIHLFLNKSGDSSHPDQHIGKKVGELLRCLDMPSRPRVSLKQVHRNQVAIIDSEPNLKTLSMQPEADAVFTRRRDLYLTIRVADCLPIYIYDPVNQVIGLIHSGWRGSLLNVTKIGIQTAATNLRLEPAACQVVIGPGIRPCCYEISSEVAILFPNETIRPRQNRYFLDLAELNQSQLIRSGVKPASIQVVKNCTFCTPEVYHSFRRTGNKAEKMYAVLGLS